MQATNPELGSRLSFNCALDHGLQESAPREQEKNDYRQGNQDTCSGNNLQIDDILAEEIIETKRGRLEIILGNEQIAGDELLVNTWIWNNVWLNARSNAKRDVLLADLSPPSTYRYVA